MKLYINIITKMDIYNIIIDNKIDNNLLYSLRKRIDWNKFSFYYYKYLTVYIILKYNKYLNYNILNDFLTIEDIHKLEIYRIVKFNYNFIILLSKYKSLKDIKMCKKLALFNYNDYNINIYNIYKIKNHGNNSFF